MVAGRGRSEIAALRKSLQAEHARIVVNLRVGHDQLKIAQQLGAAPEAEALIHAYTALLAMVERENFITMPVQRLPVVVWQIATRFERLGQRLREAQALEWPRTPYTLLH